MDSPVDQISKSLKLWRVRKGWSLDRTSKETGVSKAMLGQIERGESSPTLATLWKIATGFNVSLSSLIEYPSEDEEHAVTLIRDADKIRQVIADDDMLVAPLYPFDPKVPFEYFELTFPPGYDRPSEAHRPGVIEFLTVTTGAMEILSEEEWHSVAKGQSIRFHADRPHGYRNLSKEPATALNVIYYPRIR
ncbi:MAG: helix-turn-helix transcriptional regulator [Sneathiella sp.]|nr:helix-turn-helix transcriptional regulator [Sneathiella sp.]